MIAAFPEIATIGLDDGIQLGPNSVIAAAVRGDNTYGGTRIKLLAYIGSARCSF